MQTMAFSFTKVKQNTCWSRTDVRHVQKKKHWNIKTYMYIQLNYWKKEKYCNNVNTKKKKSLFLLNLYFWSDRFIIMMIITIQCTLRSKPKLNCYVFLNVNQKILHSLYFEIMHTYRQQNENDILKRNRPAFRIKCDVLLDLLLWTKEPV